MTNDHDKLLQQIAIDIAVIKTQLDSMKPVQEYVVKTKEDVADLKSQMAVVKWVSTIFGTGVIGMFIKVFHDKLI